MRDSRKISVTLGTSGPFLVGGLDKLVCTVKAKWSVRSESLTDLEDKWSHTFANN